MDNLTHTLVGATLARTPLSRAGRGATAALILASNAPDLDLVAAAGGAARYLQWHRGPTHGILGPIILAVATAAAVSAWYRRFDRSTSEPPASFAALAGLSLVAAGLHIVMDLPTSYGTRLLSPFDWHWFAVDWMPIVDPYLLVILLVGLWLGRGPLTKKRLAVRARNARLALILMAIIYGLRAVSHQQALAEAPAAFRFAAAIECAPTGTLHQRGLNRWPATTAGLSAIANPRCPDEIAALPTFTSPFRWRLVAAFPDGYETRDVDLLAPLLTAGEGVPGPRSSIRYPNVWTPIVERAAASPAGRIFLGFARFPAARHFTDSTGITTVRWIDVRFADAVGSRTGLLGAVVRVGPDGAVLDSRVGSK